MLQRSIAMKINSVRPSVCHTLDL